MAPEPTTRSTPRLLGDLAHQARQLLAAEIALLQAELAESAALLAAGVSRVAAGAGLLYAGLVILLVAIGFFLERLGLPQDVSFLVVALVVMGVGAYLLRSGSQGLRASQLAPTRSLAQITSLLKGL